MPSESEKLNQSVGLDDDVEELFADENAREALNEADTALSQIEDDLIHEKNLFSRSGFATNESIHITNDIEYNTLPSYHQLGSGIASDFVHHRSASRSSAASRSSTPVQLLDQQIYRTFDAHNTSIQSGISADSVPPPKIVTHAIRNNVIQSNPQQSEAIISALKALQEKVNQLTHENKELQAYNERLKSTLETYTKQVEDAEVSMRLKQEEANSIVLDRTTEIGELTTRAVKAEEQNHSLKKELEYLKNHVQELTTERQNSSKRILALEQANRDMDHELVSTKHDLTHQQESLDKTNQANSVLVENVESKCIGLEQELAQERLLRQELERKKAANDQFIGSVLQLNESLISKMSKRKLKSKKTPKKHHLAPTKNSINSSIQAHLKQLNASKELRSRSPMQLHLTSSSLRHQHRQHKSVHEELLDANKGEDVPFLLGTSTTPSFSVYASTQSKLHNDFAYGSASDANTELLNELSSSRLTETEVPKATRDSSRSMTRPRVRVADSNLAAVLKQLQSEYDELNAKYHEMLSKYTESKDVDELNTQLTALVAKLEAKSQQIVMLKKHNNVMATTRGRSPIRNPAAFDKKVKALQTLNLLRESVNHS